MSFASIYSRALLGVEALAITVETHLSQGLPGFAIVGLPETAVKESKERVRSAILNTGLEFPSRRITVNLAPADMPKSGGRYDLAIALGILAAAELIDAAWLRETEVLGELTLDGSVRAVQGAIPALLAAQEQNRRILLPTANKAELGLVGYDRAYAVSSLAAVVAHAAGSEPLASFPPDNPQPAHTDQDGDGLSQCRIRGQLAAKRGIQIAAAGGHNVLMVGPPGCGKTLLARTLVALLPPLNRAEALQVAAIRSVSRLPVAEQDCHRRPLRAPHHCTTAVALTGGGNRASPGEISLAHRGVLFLDEVAEFKPTVLDALREPLEAGEISISRANYRVTYPAAFQLVAAMNPCPCGQATNTRQSCRCSPERVSRYLAKLSGPLLDRLDLLLEMSSLTRAELLEGESNEVDWLSVRSAVAACRARQYERQGKLNHLLSAAELDRVCTLESAVRQQLARAIDRLGLSARSVHRLLRVARTVTDWEGSDNIAVPHLLEALSYRSCRLFRAAS